MLWYFLYMADWLGKYYVTIKQSYKNPIGRKEKAGGIIP